MTAVVRIMPARPASARQDRNPAQLRQWLEFVIETGIEMLDALDAEAADREDDELGDDDTEEALRA